MIKIRLARLGYKGNPFYRIVVADVRSSRDGKFIDIVGTYNPISNPVVINIDNNKAKDWIKKGAQPTDTVRALFQKCGVLDMPNKRPPAKTKVQKKKKEA